MRRTIAVCLSVAFVTAVAVEASEPTKTPVVVTIERSQKGVHYRIDGEPIQHDGLLARLSQRKGVWPAAAPDVRVLAAEDVTLHAIDDLRGLVSKAGYKWPRVFYFGRDKAMMLEITYGKGVPFSATAALPGE